MLLASAAAIPLIATLWWRGQSALPTVLVVLGLGALLGCCHGLVRRPTPLQTAMEADRQFGLHDLLGTALMLPACPSVPDASREMIQAIADARCRGLSPSQLILQRFGARAWGGIGLAAAMVISLSLLSSAPDRSIAGVDDFNRARPPVHRQDVPAFRSSPLLASGGEEQRSVQERSPGNPPSTGGADTRSAAVPIAGGRSEGGDVSSGDGIGRGASQADQAMARRDRPLHAPSRPQPDGSGSLPAGGSGASAGPAPAGDPAPAGTSSAIPHRVAPPWNSPTWSADRQAARRAVDLGAVPDAYRDLVRGYFETGVERQ
jgi:hypothetical protein